MKTKLKLGQRDKLGRLLVSNACTRGLRHLGALNLVPGGKRAAELQAAIDLHDECERQRAEGGES